MAAIRSSRAFLLAAFLTGCSPETEREAADFDPAAFNPKPECESRSFEGSLFTACKAVSGQDEIRLAWRGPDGRALRSLPALEAALGEESKRVRFAMNAGMYDEAGAPIGLYVAKGEESAPLNRRGGEGNFHLLPNGVFSVDRQGRFAVTPAARFRKKVPKPLWATQSGPMLVIDGELHPKFDHDGESRLIRNGVGARDPRTAWFVISEEGVSFGRFARFFRDALGCKNALYLDGSISSLWDRGSGRQDPHDGLGPMLIVLKPASAQRP